MVLARMSRAVNERPRRKVCFSLFLRNDRVELVPVSLQVMIVPEVGAMMFSVGALGTARPFTYDS